MTPSPRQPDEPPALTPLQREIVVLVMNGLPNREIADQLGIRPGLVGIHIGSITHALCAMSRAELAAIGTDERMPR